VRISELSTHPDDALRREALGFVEQVSATVGRPALSDHLRLDLAWHRETPAGPLVGTVTDHDGLIALALVSAGNDSSLLEVVVDPGIADSTAIRDDLAETALTFSRRQSTRSLVWWLDDPTEHDDHVAGGFGLHRWRELYEMGRSLPLTERSSVTTRAFEPGTDDAAWLRVNNRAFAGHAEQGGWTVETLRLRQSESWFDPDGFRIHEIDGEIAGYCWTKLHDHGDVLIGEIYVIAVDPAFHGRGLGRELTLAGLDWITDRGVTLANLYVDASNRPAVSLYEKLGFSVHRRRTAFATTTAHAAEETSA